MPLYGSIEQLGDGIEPMIALNYGPVLSSKTELALYFARRYLDRGISCVMVKPSRDTRFGDPGLVVSRSVIIPELPELPVIVVDPGDEWSIPERTRQFDVVFIDEAQQFWKTLGMVVWHMRDHEHKRVILSALEFTWQLQYFVTTQALALVPGIIRFQKSGFCLVDRGDGMKCKHSAPLSQKLFPDGRPVPIFSDQLVDDLGGAEKYRPRCRAHWFETTPGAIKELARGRECRFLIPDLSTDWMAR